MTLALSLQLQHNQLSMTTAQIPIPIYAVFPCYHNAYISCQLYYDMTLYSFLYDTLIRNHLSSILYDKRHEIEQSIISISTPAIENGNWVEIQGPNPLIDMKSVRLYQLIYYNYGLMQQPVVCRSNCVFCSGDKRKSHQFAYPIQFKVETVINNTTSSSKPIYKLL